MERVCIKTAHHSFIFMCSGVPYRKGRGGWGTSFPFINSHWREAFALYTWPEQMEGADEDKSASLFSGGKKKYINCTLQVNSSAGVLRPSSHC